MVLVTGATGILGRVVVLELLRMGKTVRAAKRESSNLAEVEASFRFYTDRPEFYFSQIQWVNVDFENISSIEKVLENIIEVYHCSGFVSFSPTDEKQLYQTNIEATKQLLYTCENSSVKKFCHVSSTAVLDGKNENGELDEDSNYNPKINHSAYATSKHFGEMEVWRASAEGLNAVILCPGVILGSGNWERSSGEIFRNFEENNFTFSGGTAYIDVRDVAKIAVELMEKNIFGERFIIISENRKFEDLAKKIRKKAGKTMPKVLPKTWLKTAYFANMIFGWAFPKLKLATKTNIETVENFIPVSNRKITDEIGYQFIPIDESLDFHYKNYLEDKKLNAQQP